MDLKFKKSTSYVVMLIQPYIIIKKAVALQCILHHLIYNVCMCACIYVCAHMPACILYAYVWVYSIYTQHMESI